MRRVNRSSRVEALERRMLLSLAAAGTEFRANSNIFNNQTAPAVAADGDGDFLIAWQTPGDGSGDAIFARRYTSTGADHFIDGNGPEGSDPDFRVNSFGTGNQTAPAAAIDGDGDFVIVWQSTAQDGSGEGIYAQRYNAGALRQGNEFRVNSTTTDAQYAPAVAMDADGDFVVVWTSPDGSADGVFARRYNSMGLPQGAEFRVNAFTTGTQFFPAVAMDADGDFVIAWASDGQDGSSSGAYAQRYDAAGTPQGGEFRVNTFTPNNQGFLSAAMSFSGDFVIAWESDGQDGSSTGVYARRYDATGAPLGAEFRVNTTTLSQQGTPAVSLDSDGDFLIAWEGVFSGSYDVFAKSYNAAGVPQSGEFRVNTFTSFNQDRPSVVLDHEGDVVVAWQSDGQDGAGYGIYAQRYDQSPDTAGAMVTDVVVGGDPVTQNERLVQSPTELALRISENLMTAGANGATNPANYSLTRNGVPVAITAASFAVNFSINTYEAKLTFTSPLPDGNYVVTARQSLHDLVGNPLDGDFDGVPGGNFTRVFTIAVPQPIGSEFRVNTTTNSDQRIPAIATDADGDFVVVWHSRLQDGSEYGIYGQRYNAAGTPRGAEFRINSFTTGHQMDPVVAMDFDGDFVVVWSGAGLGDATGIYAQRYNAAGLPLGGEFRVNSGTGAFQNTPAVAMDADGNFVVAWSSDNLSDGNVDTWARRYNSAGIAQTNEFRVNTFTTGSQGAPVVAMDFDGDFVIVWNSFNQEPLNLGIYAQRYNRDGVATFGEFRVNTQTTGDQFSPEVAMSSDGDFVVAWTSANQDGSGFGVYAQRYNAGGLTFGTEFLVNTTTLNGQFVHGMGMDADGDFVISWHSENQDGSADATLAQRYNALGEPQGGEFFVNTFTTQAQFAGVVGMAPDGDFVIAWTSINQDGSEDGVYAQRYGSVLAPAVNESSFLFDTSPHRLQFRFNQGVSTSLGTNDILLQNLTTAQTIPSSDLALSYDAVTNTATFSYVGSASGIAGVLPDGNYRATLLGAGIANPGGMPLPANHIFNFFFLNGDANRDGLVNLSDYNLFSANYGQSPRTFSQGDFNYDNQVNIADYNILAGRYGVALGPGADNPFWHGSGATGTSDSDDDALAGLLD